MTTPTIEDPKFVHEQGFIGMIVDDTGDIAAREYYIDHVTADGTTQRVLVSTVTEEAYRGQGLAGKIVKYTIEGALDQGYRFVAVCPYAKSWLKKHDESRYQDARDPVQPEHIPQGGSDD